MGRLAFVVLAALGCARSVEPRDGGAAPVVPAVARPHPAGPGDAVPRPADPVDAGRRSDPPAAASAGAPARDAPAIVDAPMAWSAERARLTLAYRRCHSDPAAADLAIEPRVIVLHHTGGGSATATRRYFDRVRVEAARPALAAAGAVNVSAHYVVDRDGTIYQLQPPTRFARHCIGLNHVAIGIENVGDDARRPLTDAQVAADAALIRALARRFHITHLLGHHEVMSFRDHPYFVERDPAYRNAKPDPGPRFMARVRARVADLELLGGSP